MGNAEGEITRIVSEGYNGNMFPIYTLGIVFGIIITLLTYIWRSTLSEQIKKNSKYEDIMDKLAKNQGEVNVLLAKIETKLEYHTDSINNLNLKSK